MANTAPDKQLLITEQNALDVINRIFVKECELIRPNVINDILKLVELNKANDPIRAHKLFTLQTEILNNASTIYIMADEPELLEESVLEMSILQEILKTLGR